MSFATQGASASASAIAATSAAATAAAAAAPKVEATPLEKAKGFLTGSYACSQLAACTSYPTDGPGAGRAVLTIPASDIQSSEPGWASIKLAWLTIDAEGTPFVKIELSYLLDGLGNAVTLTRGGSSEGSSANWRNIPSNKIPLGALLVSGYFKDDACKSILKWVEGGAEKGKKFYLPEGTDLQIVLKVNARPWKESNNFASRKPSKAAPGEETGLGMHLVGFQGAMVLEQGSSLLVAPAADIEVPRTLVEILSHFGMRPTAQPQAIANQGIAYNPMSAGTDASGDAILM